MWCLGSFEFPSTNRYLQGENVYVAGSSTKMFGKRLSETKFENNSSNGGGAPGSPGSKSSTLPRPFGSASNLKGSSPNMSPPTPGTKPGGGSKIGGASGGPLVSANLRAKEGKHRAPIIISSRSSSKRGGKMKPKCRALLTEGKHFAEPPPTEMIFPLSESEEAASCRHVEVNRRNMPTSGGGTPRDSTEAV